MNETEPCPIPAAPKSKHEITADTPCYMKKANWHQRGRVPNADTLANLEAILDDIIARNNDTKFTWSEDRKHVLVWADSEPVVRQDPEPNPHGEWRETDPPKDGQPLVICGGVMVHGLCTVSKVPLCALAYWSAEHKDWLYWESGLSVRRHIDDEVIVHYWLPYPLSAPGAMPAHTYQTWDDDL